MPALVSMAVPEPAPVSMAVLSEKERIMGEEHKLHEIHKSYNSCQEKLRKKEKANIHMHQLYSNHEINGLQESLEKCNQELGEKRNAYARMQTLCWNTPNVVLDPDTLEKMKAVDQSWHFGILRRKRTTLPPAPYFHGEQLFRGDFFPVPRPNPIDRDLHGSLGGGGKKPKRRKSKKRKSKRRR